MLPRLADPEAPELKATRLTIRHLKNNVAAGEKLVVVAGASDRRFRLGLLAASDRRLLFVRQALFGKEPVVISLPYAGIRNVRIEHQPLTGVLHVDLADETLTCDLVQPKARTWALWWTVNSHLRTLSA